MKKARKKKQTVVTKVEVIPSELMYLDLRNPYVVIERTPNQYDTDTKYECKYEDEGLTKIQMFILYPCLVIFLLGFGFTFLFVFVTGLATIFGR